jgi:penicillin amidase
MTVHRDAYGVPHVRADSVTELAFEQGRVTARDRAWQLDLERRRGEGVTAALLGEAGLEWDTFSRRADLAEVAQRAYAGLDDEGRAFVAAYADGVNAAFGEGVTAPELDELGARPGAWAPWTPLAVFLVQQVLFGTFPTKLWRHRVRTLVGDDALELFRTDGLSGGSNALAVGPARTASGFPIVAGDPHRTFEAPNVYQQVRLSCPGLDVAGYAFPGVPGVQHFAHAGEVAWAITNAMADYQDVHAERLERRGGDVVALTPQGEEPVERRVEAVEVRGGDDVEVEVLVTARGPVVIGGPGAAETWSLRTPSYQLGDLGFAALLPLLRARSVDDVDAAFARWVEPVNNVVVADRSGRVLHRVAGVVPDRTDDGWAGWVDDLPRHEVPGDGQFVTANERGSAAYDRIGTDFAPPFRHDRIDELLAGRDDLKPADVVAVLGDVRQNAGGVLLSVVAGLDGLTGAPARARDVLLAWPRTMGPDDAGAALYAALRDRVVERICEAEPLAPLLEGSPYGELYAAWFSLPTRVALALHVILAADRPFGLDVPALVAQALADVAEETPTPWGERHRFHPLHGLEMFGLDHEQTAPATPLPGDSDAVYAAGYLPGSPDCVRGPVARYVWDLADRDGGGWVVPLGASGVPGHPHHHDQNAAWAAGGVVPLVTDWDRLVAE